MPEYTHILIPNQPEFIPGPDQVNTFYESLRSIGAAPLEPSITVAKPTGQVRAGINPFNGDTFLLHVRTKSSLRTFAELSHELVGLQDFNVCVFGAGPPRVPALEFKFVGTYEFSVNCCLRTQIVSLSESHDEAPTYKKVVPFGQACSSNDRLGVFYNPDTLNRIEVAGAGCARFWVEFEFGKSLFPKIVDRLDLIEPSIVTVVENSFAMTFVQGCNWCA